MNFPSTKFEKKLNKVHINAFKNDEKSRDKICRNIQLSRIISIYIPEATTVNSLNYVYYTVENFKIADLFVKNLIDGYILNGDLCCSSLINKGEKNCQLFIHEKKLKLRMDKELLYKLNATYLTRFLKKSECNESFVTFEIDFNSDNLCKLRNELCFDEIDNVLINFTWKPHAEDICPSSLVKFFTEMGYKVQEKQIEYLNNTLYNIKIPSLPENCELSDETCENWSHIFERIGMILIGCNDEEMNLNELTDVEKIKRSNVLHFKGFLSTNKLNNLFEEIQMFLKDHSYCPYIALSSIPFTSLQKTFKSKLIFITPKTIFES